MRLEFLAGMLLVSSCGLYFHQDPPKDLLICNNSDIGIAYFFPSSYESGGYPVENFPYKMYPDTSMRYAYWFLCGPVLPDNSHAFEAGLVKEVYAYRNVDTLSLYIVDSYYLDSDEWVPTENGGHFINKPWDNAIKNYNVLARYDLSLEDMNCLRDEDGIVRIFYPPTPEMKGIHMYPPYKELKKNNE